MSVQKALDLLDQILVMTEQARIELGNSGTPQPSLIKSASELLAALKDGAHLKLDPSLSVPTTLKLTQINLTLESAATPAGRMTKDAPAPRFDKGLQVLGSGITLIGLDVRNSDLTDIVTIYGANCAVDRCRILGDPVKGAKRGIAANSDGNCQITGCYIDDCFGPYPGDDTQAIGAWNMAPGLLIENCYLSGGTETILIGGGDPQNPLRDPNGITIRKNTITKNPVWQSQFVSVKNTLELKNARNVLIEDNDISYSWARGQDGYLLVLTVRNQDGRNPTASIQDVVIKGNRFSHGAGAMNILGRDTIKEDKANRDVPIGTVRRSVPMARVLIANNVFDDVDSAKYSTSTKKLIQIDGGPADLTITGNAFASVGHTSTIYFAGGPMLQNFTFTNNQYPKTKYGMFGDNTTVNQAFVTYVASGVTAPNTEVP